METPDRTEEAPCAMARVSSVYNLAVIHSKIAAQLHPTKTGMLTPHPVSLSSGKKVFWLCQEGHEWQATFVKRTARGRGCPDCYKELKIGHGLHLVNPKLAREWHPAKNLGLRPMDVTYGSKKTGWWMCPKGHEWEARIDKRHRGAGCPVCRREKVRKETG
jgi:hypothetical protein